jgi:hypothetical protein
LYKVTDRYICLLHVEELLEILQCRICIADRLVHSKLEELVDMFEMLKALQSFYNIIVLPDDGTIRPKHVGVIGFYNIVVNLIKFCALLV